MTREEASNILWWASKRHYPGDQMDITEYDIEAFEIAVSAILGSQPDPDTGLVPCGCGGKAKITEQSLNWLIKCVECGIQLEVYGGRGGAVWSWNRAMGWEDKG